MAEVTGSNSRKKEETSCILSDVIITGKDDEEQPNHLEEVLKSLKEHGLRANGDKCERKITCCGHEVDKHRLRKTQEKVDAVVNAPHPTSPFIVRAGKLLPHVFVKPRHHPEFP